MMLSKSIFYIFILVYSSMAFSDIYKYVAPDGRVYYSRLPLGKNADTVIDSGDLKKINANKVLIRIMEQAVKDELSDPFSAKFKWAKIGYGNSDEGYFCGFVNSKNKFGGYVGFSPLLVELIPSGESWSVSRVLIENSPRCMQE